MYFLFLRNAYTYITNPNKVQNTSNTPERFLCPLPVYGHFYLEATVDLISTTVSEGLHIPEEDTNEIIQHLFCVCLLFEINQCCINITLHRCTRNSFLFIAEWYSTVYHSSFLHLSVNGHLGCFQFLAIMKKDAMIILV